MGRRRAAHVTGRRGQGFVSNPQPQPDTNDPGRNWVPASQATHRPRCVTCKHRFYSKYANGRCRKCYTFQRRRRKPP